MRILIVGGHLAPALSVIRQLQNLGITDLHWVGCRNTMWGDSEDSVEYKTITKLNIPFYSLRAGKFYRNYNPKKLLLIPWGFIQALYYVLKIRPSAILSFGGYLAVPVVFWGRLLRSYVFTHEQTSVVGFANRFVGFFAHKIFVTWPQSVKFFREDKVLVTGLPLRRALFTVRKNHPVFNPDFASWPMIYITGGNQGSHLINECVHEILDKLLIRAVVVHQTGSNKIYKDYEKSLALKNNLPLGKSNRYLVYDFIGEPDIGSVFSRASLIISRAGANTTYELAVLRKPSILIPIPWSSHNEQANNAHLLKKEGLAEVIDQKNLTAEILYETINKMLGNINNYTISPSNYFAKNKNADEILVSHLLKQLALSVKE